MYEMTKMSFGSLEFHIKKGQVENSKERKKKKEEKKDKEKREKKKRKEYTGKNGVKCSKISQKNRPA